VWASQADQAAFMESRLGPALGAASVTAVPAVRWVPLRAYPRARGLTPARIHHAGR